MAIGKRSVFYGFGAWVGHQTSRTGCRWWANDPSMIQPPFDPQHLITTDLAKSPQAVRTGAIQIADVEVDDPPQYGGGTKVGPTWPTGSMWNALWLESGKYANLPVGTRPNRLNYGMQCREYELTTVLYWDGPLKGRRFWGYHAEITSEQGTQALVSIWPAGRSRIPGQLPIGTWWLDLSNVGHPIEPDFTQIGVGLGVAKQGALFLESQSITSLSISDPKLPPACAADFYPPPR
jgi:hypothetical protein